MENKKRIIEISFYMPVLQELLEQGKEVSLTITGNSMSPFLIHGRDAVWVTPPDGKWRKGDMAFFQRTNGQYVMHRICKITLEGYYFVGDGQQQVEGPIVEAQIFGKIMAVRRKGIWIREGDFWWEFFAHFWLKVIPFREALKKCYGVIWCMKNKCVIP